MGSPRGPHATTHSLPFAVLAAAGLGRLVQIEVDIVGDEDIEVAVAIVIDEGAARTPARAGDRQAGLGGDVGEFAVAAIAVEAVRPVVGDEQVGLAVIIEIADAGGLRPAGAREAGLPADLGEVAFAVVAIELRVGRRRAGREDAFRWR